MALLQLRNLAGFEKPGQEQDSQSEEGETALEHWQGICSCFFCSGHNFPVSLSPHSSPSILLWPRASGLTPSKSQNANHLGSFRMLTPKPHFQTSSLNWSELNSSIDILKSSPGTFNLQAGCRTTAFRCSNPGPTPPALVLVFSMMPAENNDTNNNDTCHYYSQQEPTISEHLLYVRQCSNSFTGMNTLNSHF